MRTLFSCILLTLAAAGLAGPGADARGQANPSDTARPMNPTRLQYPGTPKGDTVDVYHGVRVADPYRWLEDASSPETLAWVDAQNSLTRAWLDGRVRERIKSRLAELRDFPRTSEAEKRGQRFFYRRNSGLQNQSELVVRDGPTGPTRVLLDPNALSPDGTVALTGIAITDDGRLMAYALSRSGSDRQELRVRDVDTGEDRPDVIRWIKFASLEWLSDATGFYYTRFPEPGTVAPGDENYYCKVFFHRLGDDQAKDQLIFDRPDDKEIVFSVGLSADDRLLVIGGFKGASDKSDVHVLDRRSPDAKPLLLFRGFADAWSYIDGVGARLFFQTDLDAPRSRIVSVTLPDRLVPLAHGRARIAGAELTEVVPEGPDKLSSAAIAGNTIVAIHQHHASDRVDLFGLDGKPSGTIVLPAVGSITSLSGRPEDPEFLVDFESFTRPRTPFRYDPATRQLAPLAETKAPIDPGAYEIEQVWYPSRDRTNVSMFVVHRTGLERDGNRPTLLSGYGGFNISMTPAFDPSAFAWLDAGGVYALANLRGGGEYGEAWHQAGMLDRKQNVFDDMIAAAEWLVANRYTSPRRLAIEGASNGGLLVGAAEVQRPDLFGAVICRVPVADMLRYHLFTVGRFWIPEYGSSDDPRQFPFLHRYSPLHNVKDGIAYPATLVMTADTDDRVAPGMAKKFAARLQAATAGPAPILLRVETKAGHGAGKPIGKIIDEDADTLTFLFRVFGMAS